MSRKMGYSYVAICDHSQAARYAHGLAADRLVAEIEEIEAINQKLKGFRILKGTEVDILADGSLDFPDELLARLDFVVAAIHSGFRKNVTARMLKALENPHVRAIAHPSGRLISRREGYEVDLDELHLKKAKQKGVKISIGTDTHFADGLAMMRFGVGIARRSWLEKDDVLNTLSASDLLRRAPSRRTSAKRRT